MGLWSAAFAADLPQVRVATLSFGTVAWEISTLQHHQLAQRYGVELVHIPVANNDASTIALQGGAADVVVSNWFWVSRQRGAGRPYQFVPHTLASGALVVHKDRRFNNLPDLGGMRLGVGGGPTDKSWLLLQAYAQQQHALDLRQSTELEFAAPPTLNQLLNRGRLDAVLNFWHFNTRLIAAGHQPVLQVTDMLAALDVHEPLPLLGWVFAEDFARRQPAALAGFLAASRAAKDMLRSDDAEWQRLRPKMKAPDQATFVALREAYRAGIPSPGMQVNRREAAALYARLAELGGPALVGRSPTLSEGVFWTPPSTP
jgi:NitT/TauT family transport system substrate-binding protein